MWDAHPFLVNKSLIAKLRDHASTLSESKVNRIQLAGQSIQLFEDYTPEDYWVFTPSYVHVAGIQLIVIGDTIYFWISLMYYVHYTEISLRWLETHKISPSGGFMMIYHGR